jgi:hypothetical protein
LGYVGGADMSAVSKRCSLHSGVQILPRVFPVEMASTGPPQETG